MPNPPATAMTMNASRTSVGSMLRCRAIPALTPAIMRSSRGRSRRGAELRGVVADMPRIVQDERHRAYWELPLGDRGPVAFSPATAGRIGVPLTIRPVGRLAYALP